MVEVNKVYNMDCLEGMKTLPDKSVDCIICDLPYGVLNKSNPNAQWDSIIPLDKLWEQYERIIKGLENKEYLYNAKKANSAILFIENFCKHHEGQHICQQDQYVRCWVVF